MANFFCSNPIIFFFFLINKISPFGMHDMCCFTLVQKGSLFISTLSRNSLLHYFSIFLTIVFSWNLYESWCNHWLMFWKNILSLQIYLYFGHLAVTTALAFIASLLFESPFIGLERLIFRRAPRKKIENIHKQALEVWYMNTEHLLTYFVLIFVELIIFYISQIFWRSPPPCIVLENISLI